MRIEPKERIKPRTVPNNPNSGDKAITASKSFSPRRIPAISSAAVDSSANLKVSGSLFCKLKGAYKNLPMGCFLACSAIASAISQSSPAASKTRLTISFSWVRIRNQNHRRSKITLTDRTDKTSKGHIAAPPLLNKSKISTVQFSSLHSE